MSNQSMDEPGPAAGPMPVGGNSGVAPVLSADVTTEAGCTAHGLEGQALADVVLNDGKKLTLCDPCRRRAQELLRAAGGELVTLDQIKAVMLEMLPKVHEGVLALSKSIGGLDLPSDETSMEIGARVMIRRAAFVGVVTKFLLAYGASALPRAMFLTVIEEAVGMITAEVSKLEDEKQRAPESASAPAPAAPGAAVTGPDGPYHDR